MSREIILHLLTWKLKDIENKLEKISEQGFTAIQISPIQPTKDEGFEWWKLYQPIDFSIGNVQIGTKEDLMSLCNKAKIFGLKIFVDIVLRHTAGKDSGELAPHEKVDNSITSRNDFWGDFKNIQNYDNRWENNNLCVGLPVLNYNNVDLQNVYSSFLNKLIDCGVSGFRIDMGKHFSLPSEGGNFWNNVVLPLKNRNVYIYSECIDLGENYLKEYMQYTNVITNNYYVIDESKEVRYIESHDTYLSFGYTKNMNDEDLINSWSSLIQGGNYSVMFYSRPWSNLWQDYRIMNINHLYNRKCS